MPIQLDAKLNAFRRSSRGFYITLEIGPDSDWSELAAAPLGSAFGVAMVAYDAETGKREDASPGYAASVAGPTGQLRGEPGKPRRHFTSMPRANQAGILCADLKFQLWLSDRLGILEPQTCAETLRNYLGVGSRAELDDGMNDRAAVKFDQLVSAYRSETGMMAEQR